MKKITLALMVLALGSSTTGFSCPLADAAAQKSKRDVASAQQYTDEAQSDEQWQAEDNAEEHAGTKYDNREFHGNRQR